MASTAELKAGMQMGAPMKQARSLVTLHLCAWPAAVTDSLENSGKLEQLRAKVRAGIYEALESPQVQCN